jgi:outer membrane protein assembly factor BamB
MIARNRAASRAASASLMAVGASLLLAGCSMMPSLPSFLGGAPDRPKPAELAPNPALIGVRQAWTARIGQVAMPLSVGVAGTQVAVAGTDGTVALLDASSGREAWRASAGAPLAAGVGTDGKLAAVVTRANDVVALADGKVAWTQKLAAQAFTAPFVAGGRVFVLGADRSVTAFDGETGRRLWTQQRPGEPLVLRQQGVLLAVGDTLVAGQSGRLAGLNPANGSIRWEAPIATPRGTNDIERLVELVGGVSRVGDTVCARAFQAAVGCVNAARGLPVWSKPANGSEGLHGDERLVVGTETDGRVVAWKRDNGERAWVHDQLLYRSLSAPLVTGNSVAVGDANGNVHVLSRDDGKLLTRLATDGSAIAAPPVIVGNTMVVVTRAGSVYGFVPQ